MALTQSKARHAVQIDSNESIAGDVFAIAQTAAVKSI
jgi:hypothetical protein